MGIGDICTRHVVTCRRDTSAVEIARLMRDSRVGDVVVVEGDAEQAIPVGIVTDRDLVMRVLAREVEPHDVLAQDVMSANLVTALESEAVFDAIWHMRRNGARRLPIVDAHNVLRGILTMDDVTRFLARELGDTSGIGPASSHERSRS
jgi:signal-transduction protein with cAMP-binding, CBS, and nucleotidyltransferase domain